VQLSAVTDGTGVYAGWLQMPKRTFVDLIFVSFDKNSTQQVVAVEATNEKKREKQHLRHQGARAADRVSPRNRQFWVDIAV